MHVDQLDHFFFRVLVDSTARIQHHVHSGHTEFELAVELYSRAVVLGNLPELCWKFGQPRNLHGLLAFRLAI